MARLGIAVDLSELVPLGAPLTRGEFPNLAAAVQVVAEKAHHQWVNYAMGAPLPSGQSIGVRSGTYARSIVLNQTGEFSAEVVSHLAYASAIEYGLPERDLKQMLRHSLKVRVTATGKRYLIIPFRHDTPGALQNHLPAPLADWWQGRKPSAITGTYRRVSGTGAHDIRTRALLTVPGWRYRWGDRLGRQDLEDMGIKGTEARKWAGMVNFRKPGGRGGSSHSKYLTFRVMMEGSSGWIARATPGRFPARTVAEQIQPLAEEVWSRAVEADVATYLGAAAAP